MQNNAKWTKYENVNKHRAPKGQKLPWDKGTRLSTVYGGRGSHVRWVSSSIIILVLCSSWGYFSHFKHFTILHWSLIWLAYTFCPGPHLNLGPGDDRGFTACQAQVEHLWAVIRARSLEGLCPRSPSLTRRNRKGQEARSQPRSCWDQIPAPKALFLWSLSYWQFHAATPIRGATPRPREAECPWMTGQRMHRGHSSTELAGGHRAPRAARMSAPCLHASQHALPLSAEHHHDRGPDSRSPDTCLSHSCLPSSPSHASLRALSNCGAKLPVPGRCLIIHGTVNDAHCVSIALS